MRHHGQLYLGINRLIIQRNCPHKSTASNNTRRPPNNVRARRTDYHRNSDISRPTPATVRPPLPTPEPQEDAPAQLYDEVPPPRVRSHPRYIPRSIPQGSPPLARAHEINVPYYYREYLHPDVSPAYRFICHSSWHVQVSDALIMCQDCATSEHVFCASNRPWTVWRHMHILSRNYMHTTHCGRCYCLLLRTRRAIDCYICRLYIIQHYQQIERIVYKLICETSVSYNIDANP